MFFTSFPFGSCLIAIDSEETMVSKQTFRSKYAFSIASKRCVAQVNRAMRSWFLSVFFVGLVSHFLGIFPKIANYTATVKSERTWKNILVPSGNGHSIGLSNCLNEFVPVQIMASLGPFEAKTGKKPVESRWCVAALAATYQLSIRFTMLVLHSIYVEFHSLSNGLGFE